MGTREITVKDVSFTVDQPYEAGHAVTAAEAAALNQARAENIGNNLRSRVTKALDEKDSTTMEEVQAYAKEYNEKYTFEMGGGGRALDPVEREARKIARQAVSAKIKATGKKVSEYSSESITAMVNKLARENADIIKEAKKRIKAEDALPTIEMELEGL